MLKITVLAMLGVLSVAVLKRGAPEISLLLVLATGLCILFQAVQAFEQVVEELKELASLAQLEDTVLRPVVKTVGLSLVTKVTGELCRGAGETGIAAFVETAGTTLALAVALPLAKEVLELMAQLMT